MAMTKKTAPAADPAATQEVRIAQSDPLNPDSFVQGGLADDIDGTITSAVYRPWFANRKRITEGGANEAPQWKIVLDLEITPDDAGENDPPVLSLYSMADLRNFLPSNDGISPAGGTHEEYAALAKGEVSEVPSEEDLRSGEYSGYYPSFVPGGKNLLPKGSNFLHFWQALVDSGFVRDDNLAGSLSPAMDSRQLLGVRCHWNRLPMERKAGGNDKFARGNIDPLVPTQFHERRAIAGATANTKATATPATSAATAKAGAPATTPAASTPGGDVQVSAELQERIQNSVVELIAGDATGAITKPSLIGKLLPQYPEKSERAGMLACLSSIAWLSSADRPWAFDATKNSVSLA